MVITAEQVNAMEIMAKRMAKSGIFPAIRNNADAAFAIIQIGTELGVGPGAMLQNVYMSKGGLSYSSGLMAALVRKKCLSLEYGKDNSDKKATVTITRANSDGSVSTYTHTFTIQDAIRAALANKETYRQYPQNLLEARALTMCARKAFPDLLAGVYTHEEKESITGDNMEREQLSNPDPVENTPAANAERGEEEKSEVLSAIEKALEAMQKEEWLGVELGKHIRAYIKKLKDPNTRITCDDATMVLLNYQIKQVLGKNQELFTESETDDIDNQRVQNKGDKIKLGAILETAKALLAEKEQKLDDVEPLEEDIPWRECACGHCNNAGDDCATTADAECACMTCTQFPGCDESRRDLKKNTTTMTMMNGMLTERRDCGDKDAGIEDEINKITEEVMELGSKLNDTRIADNVSAVGILQDRSHVLLSLSRYKNQLQAKLESEKPRDRA